MGPHWNGEAKQLQSDLVPEAFVLRTGYITGRELRLSLLKYRLGLEKKQPGKMPGMMFKYQVK
jgi:hypothetical protein